MIVSSYLNTKPSLELPGVVKRDVICADKGAPNFCMRVFDVEPGSSTPSHQHPWEHEVYILEGEGVLTFEGEERPFSKDHFVFVPEGMEHSFRNTGSSKLEFICIVPV